MDYEQKYKEALERAKKFHTPDSNNGNLKAVLELIFPQLAESEDERIRKSIVHLLQVGGYMSPEDKTKAFAWLEKQKEQKPEQYDIDVLEKHITKDSISELALTVIVRNGWKIVGKEQKPADDKVFEEWIDDWWKHYKVNNPDSYDNGDEIQFDERGFKNFCRGIKNMYAEQKSAEWSEEDEKMLVHVVELLELNCDFSEINNEISWLKSLSRKKIWNKEDERILKGIVGLIDHNQHYDVSNKDMLNWLKSLKPQPKQEWSEEDEEMIDTIIRDLKRLGGDIANVNPAYKEEIDWLRSLSPQPHKEIYQAAKHDLAIKFMNYLDENRPNRKMGLSNGECEEIDKAFKENNWEKIIRYAEKYGKKN